MTAAKNVVNWFEIPVHDLQRAQRFYAGVFGVELTRSDMGPLQMALFPIAHQVPGTCGALVKAEGYAPSHLGTVVYFTVGDIEATLAKIEAGGGKPLSPKTSIGEYGYIAHFEDSEGNRVALHSDG
jgi:predicted enzyme related to lactoylglutathione lyase